MQIKRINKKAFQLAHGICCKIRFVKISILNGDKL